MRGVFFPLKTAGFFSQWDFQNLAGTCTRSATLIDTQPPLKATIGVAEGHWIGTGGGSDVAHLWLHQEGSRVSSQISYCRHIRNTELYVGTQSNASRRCQARCRLAPWWWVPGEAL